MTEEQRRKIVRLAAIYLMQADIPGAPSGAIGPPSRWWSEAEAVIDIVEPHFRELFREDGS